MEFHIKETLSSLTQEIILDYIDLHGQRKCFSRNIPTSYSCTENINYYDYIKESMEREVREELADQAMQISSQLNERRSMVGIDNYVISPLRPNASNWLSASILYDSDTTVTVADPIKCGYYPSETWEHEIEINVPLGKRSVTIKKKHKVGEKIVITEQDIVKAMQEKIEECKFQIITKRAERRAEDLLRSFISEVDFRNYKEKGYFLVKSGNRLFKIYKDKNKWCDMWEEDSEGIFVPRNRLCTHTQTKDLPEADEAIAKLMLVRSNRIIDHANLHPIDNFGAYYIGEQMNRLKAKELVLN